MDYKILGGERKSRERKKIKKTLLRFQKEKVCVRERVWSRHCFLQEVSFSEISHSLSSFFFLFLKKVKRISLVIWNQIPNFGLVLGFFFHFSLKTLWLQADLGLQVVVFLHFVYKTGRLRCLLSVESSFSWSCSSWMRRSSKRLFISKNFKFFIFTLQLLLMFFVMTDYWLFFGVMWCENK
jgi:hypothetical protein